jgi:glycosyltransferase involved in cell wall biosynthesis
VQIRHVYTPPRRPRGEQINICAIASASLSARTALQRQSGGLDLVRDHRTLVTSHHSPNAAHGSLRLGFACAWWHPPEQTWSYTATRLRSALDDRVHLIDIEAQRTLGGKALLRALHAPLPGRPWQYSAIERALVDRSVQRAVRRDELDAVLAVADVDTITELPTFLYQDMNAAVALSQHASVAARYVNTLPTKPALLRRRGERQLERAARATTIFAMSEWYADLLVKDHGMARDRVVVVPAGMNNPPTAYRPPTDGPSGRILFVGTDFFRKGGDLAVEAVRRLRAQGDRSVELTIVGPTRWPLPGSPPPWVDFRGLMAPADVSVLLPHHDVFVMPSRFEAFGIALVEALVAGLACVARDAFAMPEILDEGVTGALVKSDDPDELGGAIHGLLADPGIYDRVAAARPGLLERHTWATAASSMTDHIACKIGL